jgi:hypothetical protein
MWLLLDQVTVDRHSVRLEGSPAILEKLASRGLPNSSPGVLSVVQEWRAIPVRRENFCAQVRRANCANFSGRAAKLYLATCCRRCDRVSKGAIPAIFAQWLDQFPADKIVELSHHQMKPNPAVLLEICRVEGFRPVEACYVGDSVARDILMAKRANVFSIWASYGTQHDPILYDMLVRVTNWTAKDVEREKKLREQARSIQPDLIAEASFADVLKAFDLDQPKSNVA